MRKYISPEIKRQYLEWLLVPPGLREPKTKKELAEQLGVSDRSFYNWEATQEFQEELFTLKRQMGATWYADLLGGLYDLAMRGAPPQRVAATKLLLDHLNVMPQEKGEDKLSDERIAQILESLEKEGYQVIGK